MSVFFIGRKDRLIQQAGVDLILRLGLVIRLIHTFPKIHC